MRINYGSFSKRVFHFDATMEILPTCMRLGNSSKIGYADEVYEMDIGRSGRV